MLWMGVQIVLILFACAQPAFCGVKVMLTTQESLQFAGNLTLVIENVDPQAGRAWLTLYNNDNALVSSVLGVGDHFVYYGVKRIDVQIVNIYAGGDRDLVVLDVIEGILASPEGYHKKSVVEEVEEKRKEASGFCAAEAFIALALGIFAIALYE